MYRICNLLLIVPAVMALCEPVRATTGLTDYRTTFRQAWQAAGRGDQSAMRSHLPRLQGYLLEPYLRYEDLRQNRATANEQQIAGFLDQHRGWAFTPGLRNVWLKTLGRQKRWNALIRNAGTGRVGTEVQCHLAAARAETGATADLLPSVQALWLVGRSQHKACDPAFDWMRKQHGIPESLVWRRIELALAAGNASLARYLARFVPSNSRAWVDRYTELMIRPQSAAGISKGWADRPRNRRMLTLAVKRLARRDADAAWRTWQQLAKRYPWTEQEVATATYDIGLYSAVELASDALARIDRVPVAYRDARLLEWRTRAALASGDWAEVLGSIARMPDERRGDERWRYWRARALDALGQKSEAAGLFDGLASEANYHGFLAADRLDRPYTICPVEPNIDKDRLQAMRAQPGIQRALELRAVELDSFADMEWQNSVRGLDREGLRHAAALAVETGWPDRAIFALGNSGDLRFYEWRFPLINQSQVMKKAGQHRLDSHWIYGLMRSESAMNPRAISSANARGLMQVTPATARQLSRRHRLAYQGAKQLLNPEYNIALGTAYLRDLLNDFNGNPILVAGAYNAGPQAVQRWLAERPITEPDIWVELIPYFETRDYIPRVLAFTTIYDWKEDGRARRVSSRMLPLTATGSRPQTTDVICPLEG